MNECCDAYTVEDLAQQLRAGLIVRVNACVGSIPTSHKRFERATERTSLDARVRGLVQQMLKALDEGQHLVWVRKTLQPNGENTAVTHEELVIAVADALQLSQADRAALSAAQPPADAA